MLTFTIKETKNSVIVTLNPKSKHESRKVISDWVIGRTASQVSKAIEILLEEHKARKGACAMFNK